MKIIKKYYLAIILVTRIHKTVQKDLNDPDLQWVTMTHCNHCGYNGVITHLEPDILACKVKWALGSVTANKVSGGDGIPVELFHILKDDAVKVLTSIYQQIWGTHPWPQDWRKSNLKEGQCKECSNYCSIALFSQASKFSSVPQLYPTLWDPTDCSTPGLPVHYPLLELSITNTWSCPSPTPRACSNSCPSSWWCNPTISSSVDPFFTYFQCFPTSGSFPRVSSLHQMAKVLELELHHQSFQWIFRTDFL